jgi:hypothetical protein
MNANDGDVRFVLPVAGLHSSWELIFDTTRPVAPPAGMRINVAEPYVMRGRTLVLLVAR